MIKNPAKNQLSPLFSESTFISFSKYRKSSFGRVYYSGIYIKTKLITSYKQRQAHETPAQEVIHFT